MLSQLYGSWPQLSPGPNSKCARPDAVQAVLIDATQAPVWFAMAEAAIQNRKLFVARFALEECLKASPGVHGCCIVEREHSKDPQDHKTTQF